MTVETKKQVPADGRPGAEARPSCDLMTYDETAALLGLPKGTLYSWVHERRVPHIRLGPRLVRFSRRAMTAWLEAHVVAESAEPPVKAG